MLDERRMQSILLQSWSLDSSTKWQADKPADGQCSVTALVIHDLFGGEIVKTMAPGGWHFYNRIDGKRYDFTHMQFAEEIDFLDIPSNREEAFTDTSERQYQALSQRVRLHLADAADARQK